ncbi:MULTISPECIES: NADH-ubiquinone oxidoreductase subunit NDUFA12 family protein [Wolbachia]|uniref:NADH-ubiquinone oxidoreductase subunit NDUFA12 family protein n=1 Tax=Wolbachia TaxID=953 RepID=UPI0015FB74F2|nr:MULTISPECIES: NADH-ubiquinone oxidoreductase subunit NDUFA12 family protein [Wolbachia]MBA8755389.1 NADH:ubiquinone oxidoreductase [Wolbachia pipientis]MBS9530783.1 NADH:ubiquinone oxidoreductase [Wolbachia endosymbiont of Rhagoletis cerasi]MDE5056234.1 NADH-ubiquinone oxidoreductase subunit NDUFA12 family protein [Wolbachia endosymbiont of Drosophila bicornuta]
MLSKICNAIKRLLRREDKFVGRDENGNSYYESSKGKRWVMYSSVSEPTTVPPEWHIWLHYTDNVVPVNNKKRKVKHTPNLTGTKGAYYPNQKVKNYYKSWSPDN